MMKNYKIGEKIKLDGGGNLLLMRRLMLLLIKREGLLEKRLVCWVLREYLLMVLVMGVVGMRVLVARGLLREAGRLLGM